MELLIVVVCLLVLNAAAARWAHDSRDGFSSTAGRRRFRF
jgi:hypothetical protein